MEMKLFLFLPILTFLHMKGYKMTSMVLAFAASVKGLQMYGHRLATSKLAPGYLLIFDPDTASKVFFDALMHVDSYFAGVFLGLFYEEIKHYRVF